MDLFNITDGSIIKQVFLSSGNIADDYQIWQKPKNCKFISILAIGGGGGGGAGFSALNNTATGGGGGGSSSITNGFFQANLLPDILYIRVGVGGIGGTNSPVVAATSGSLSFVATTLPGVTTATLIRSGGSVAGAGGAGTGAAGGGAGSGGGVFIQTNQTMSYLGIIQTIAGQAGGSGGANTPTSINITLPVTGGAGGAGVTSAGIPALGANITGAGFVPTITGGNGALDIKGNNGFEPTISSINSFMRNSFFTTGGAGGGSSPVANGGAGGNGSFGSGGGGGGASYIGTTNGGAGGNGGDGIVIITAW